MLMNEVGFIQGLKKSDKRALNYMLDKYSWIVKTVTVKHLPAYMDKRDECIEKALLAIWEHADAYDENNNTFANWVAGITRYHVIMSIREYLEEKQPKAEVRKILEEELYEEIESLIDSLDKKEGNLFSGNAYLVLNEVETRANLYIKEDVTKAEIRKWKQLLKKRMENSNYFTKRYKFA